MIRHFRQEMYRSRISIHSTDRYNIIRIIIFSLSISQLLINIFNFFNYVSIMFQNYIYFSYFLMSIYTITINYIIYHYNKKIYVRFVTGPINL